MSDTLNPQQICIVDMSTFLTAIAISTAFLAIFVAIAAWLNIYRSHEIGKLEKKIKLVNDDVMKYLQSFCFDIAAYHWQKGEILDHFSKLAFYYKLSLKSNIYTYTDTSELDHLRNFMKEYKNYPLNEVVVFLEPFRKIIDNCKDKHYRINAEKIWKDLCNLFGGKDKVKEAIRDFDPKEAYCSLSIPRVEKSN